MSKYSCMNKEAMIFFIQIKYYIVIKRMKPLNLPLQFLEMEGFMFSKTQSEGKGHVQNYLFHVMNTVTQ